MRQEVEDELLRGLNELELEHSLSNALKRYVDEIILWNSKVGLVKANEHELVVRHVLDSAAAIPWFDEYVLSHHGADIADLGSGAGFPGIVLALGLRERNNIAIHLIEKQFRRSSFLMNVLPILGLGGLVSVHNQRVETLDMKFDIVTTRAFAKFSPLQFRLQMSLLKPSGQIVAYKGRRKQILEEFKNLFPDNGQIIPLNVPFLDEERHLVVLKNYLD